MTGPKSGAAYRAVKRTWAAGGLPQSPRPLGCCLGCVVSAPHRVEVDLLAVDFASESDRRYFECHPGRCLRLRPLVPGELLVTSGRGGY